MLGAYDTDALVADGDRLSGQSDDTFDERARRRELAILQALYKRAFARAGKAEDDDIASFGLRKAVGKAIGDEVIPIIERGFHRRARNDVRRGDEEADEEREAEREHHVRCECRG